MNKRVAITVIAGLASVLATMAGSAAQVAPGQGRYPTPAHEHEDFCTEGMGHMRSVSSADIQAISFDQAIVLVPVCEDAQLRARRETYGTLFIDGNVNAVRQPIARNRALISALASQNYDEQDVISLRFGGNDSIILYVHQRDMN